jgi:hypothetical protein
MILQENFVGVFQQLTADGSQAAAIIIDLVMEIFFLVLIDSIICLFVSFSLFDVHVYLVQGY